MITDIADRVVWVIFAATCILKGYSSSDCANMADSLLSSLKSRNL